MHPENNTTPSPKVHIETWGCQMNVADSEQMLSLLKEQNYSRTEVPEDADLIILNTCHIREKAKHKVVSRLGVLKELKKANPKLTIAVTGCVAQAEGAKLFKEAASIDVLVGPGKIKDLPGLVSEHKSGRKKVSSLGFAKEREKKEIIVNEEKSETGQAASQEMACQKEILPESLSGYNNVSRYLNIQQGCNNFCTFCVVPFTRGKEVSELPDKIFARAQALVETGAKEITLLGQNVNSYGLDLVKEGKTSLEDGGPFVGLLKMVATIPGLQRLRFTTSNPHDLNYELATLFAKERKLASYFHLPLQSGSNKILESMRRKLTSEQYLERVGWLKQAVPDIALSTDLIVGFPGETDEDFEETLSLVEKVRFSFVFAFAYSPRKGTAGIRFRDQLPEELKSKRLAKLNAIQDKITIDWNKQEEDQEREVLFLYKCRKEADHYYGRTLQFRLVRVMSKQNIVGKIFPVRILNSNKTALSGILTP